MMKKIISIHKYNQYVYYVKHSMAVIYKIYLYYHILSCIKTL